MILVDTSVWIDHLRTSNLTLTRLLEDGRVISHPIVVGEIALGNLRNRREVLEALTQLPQAVEARDEEVMTFIEAHSLHGEGVGYVDAHLLAAVRLTTDARLWTGDRRLRDLAERLSVAFHPEG